MLVTVVLSHFHDVFKSLLCREPLKRQNCLVKELIAYHILLYIFAFSYSGQDQGQGHKKDETHLITDPIIELFRTLIMTVYLCVQPYLLNSVPEEKKYPN